ncbi:hypothetical protein RHECIAT_CH0003799 [Rhizobium etli CIAT 652]|uniref:Uncharacterized protein n=1 Tax=Rhizobium etli (strain CIAT 652) TaxID=491916 RepID=B3PZT7_RHIE6|nr:hypothetical protein RHECIAT_CH0003799 [Rhizobium etli CIAT 652]
MPIIEVSEAADAIGSRQPIADSLDATGLVSLGQAHCDHYPCRNYPPEAFCRLYPLEDRRERMS